MTTTTHYVGDTAVLTGRTLRHVTRSLDTIITTAVMPIAMMLLFVYVFGGAIETGTDSYVNYMLPGILLMGIRSGAAVLAWLAVAGILVLFTLAMTWIAVIAGLSASTVEGAGAFSYPLIFLPFISSAFVPTDTMPGPVRAFAEHQPVTSIVNTIRDLLAQQPLGNDLWIALAWCVGLLAVAYAVAMAVYHRKFA